MSVREMKDRPGWYTVVVYDRVSATGQRPAKVSRRVKGLRNAQKVERDLENQRERGSLIARSQSLSAYAARWLESRRAEVSRQTHSGYSRMVGEYIDRHAIGAMKVSDIDVTAVSTFYADVLERGSVGRPVSPATVRGVHRVLSMILKRATIDGLLHVNPCAVAKPPKDGGIERRDSEAGIDPEAAQRFLAAVEGSPVYTIAAVGLGTGLRRSELLGLQWQDIDLDAGELHVLGKLEQVGKRVERTAPKTKRSRRTVPFGDRVASVLRQQKRVVARERLRLTKDGLWSEEGWVFPSLRVSFTRGRELLPAGRCWTPSAFAQEWRKVTRSRDVGGIGIHDLRHCYATAQLAAGVRDEVVSRRMGHSSSLVTRRVYSHVVDSERRDGIDVVDRLL